MENIVEDLITLAVFGTCLLVPILLVGGLIWLVTRKSRVQSASKRAQPNFPAARPPSSGHSAQVTLDLIEGQLRQWQRQDRLPADMVTTLATLIQEDRQALRIAPPPVTPAARTADPAPPPPAGDQQQRPTIRPVATPQSVPPAPAAGGAIPPAASPGPIAVEPPEPPTPAAARTPGKQLREATLAGHVRRTLLYLGTFLIIVSALTLIVFSWTVPLLNFVLLLAVCGTVWGGGALLARDPGLRRAGQNLQAVAALLFPFVAFSLARPGLLELDLRMGWLLAAVLSLPIYLLSVWRTRRLLYAFGACLIAASGLIAGLTFVPASRLPAVLVLVFSGYQALAYFGRKSAAADLAPAPFWTAQIGVPFTLLLTLALLIGDALSISAFAVTCWTITAFYALTAGLERRPFWTWAAAVGLGFTAHVTLAAFDPAPAWWGLTLGSLALAYFGAAVWLEPRAVRHSLPSYTGAALMGVLALLNAMGSATSQRWTLLLLIILGTAVPLATAHGRLSWAAPQLRNLIAATTLAGSVVLLPFWLLILLEPLDWPATYQALVLVGLAVLYFFAALRWPGGLARPYKTVLQAGGALVLAGATIPLIGTDGLQLAGLVAVSLVWIGQAVVRRHGIWVLPALGSILLTLLVFVERFAPAGDETTTTSWMLAFLGYTLVVLLATTLVRRNAWRYWTWPGLGWGALTGLATLSLVFEGFLRADRVLAVHVAAVLALAAVIAMLSALWRRAWPGYLAAVLLALAGGMSATRGFFTGWQPELGDYGYVLVGLAVGLALVGSLVRRFERGYAYPYEVTGLALLTLAPLPTLASNTHATLTWLAVGLLYGLATWRYRQPWGIAPAFAAVDIALLHGAGWLLPGGNPAGVSLLLAGATWLQALFGLAVRSARQQRDLRIWAGLAQPALVVAVLSGSAALLIASFDAGYLAATALALAGLLVLAAMVETSPLLAWAALAMLAPGLASLHRFLEIAPQWSVAWGMGEALALTLLGWASELTAKRFARLQIWQAPLSSGTLAASLVLSLLVAPVVAFDAELAPLIASLALLSLILATLAVRRRRIEYAYAAGAALVGAGLFQLYDWGQRQPQWFVIPSGLYLLALAAGLRRFQGRRRVSRVVEAGAVLLMLGTTFGQALRFETWTANLYTLLLCGQALLVLAYGALARLRVPFISGIAFFVAGVLWLSVDPLRAVNQWVLIGIAGLLMIGAYVLLERRQEQLSRAGRSFVERMNAWQ